jgi:hypothetical protein
MLNLDVIQEIVRHFSKELSSVDKELAIPNPWFLGDFETSDLSSSEE